VLFHRLEQIQGYHYSNDESNYVLFIGFAHGSVCLLIATHTQANNKNKNELESLIQIQENQPF
jgi:hypothetical protein